MEQLNRKTKEVKTTQIFTTNWYLYKTYLYSISTKSQERDTIKAVDSYDTKTRKKNRSPKAKAKKGTRDFEELLTEAIDEGLSLLGESSRQVVYFYLEKTFKMKKLDIPYRIEEFIDAIEKIFGNGAKILEIQIMKCLYKKAGNKIKHYSEQRSLEFTEYVEAVKLAKKNYENSKRQQPNPNCKHN
jgi:hypothetical protein